MGNRTCRACELVKPLDEFANAGTVKGVKYYRHLCKPCYLEMKKVRTKKLRELYYVFKKTQSCEKCGEDDFRVLDFDHIDPKKKSFNLGDAVGRGYATERWLEEIDKCQVLCANCHRRKTWDENNGV